MNAILKHWLADSLIGLGAEVERETAGAAVTVLMEPNLAAKLGLDTFCRIGFDAGEDTAQTVAASPDLIDRLAELTAGHGAFASVRLTPPAAVPALTQSRAERFLTVGNGKVVFDGLEPSEQTWLVCFGRYSAVSDEKREAIVSAAVNVRTGTISPGLGPATETAVELAAGFEELPPPADIPRDTLASLADMLRWETVRQVEEFRETLVKRIVRDRDRLHRYYSDLLEAAREPATGRRKKATPDERAQRAAAITQEYTRKIDDLKTRYLMKVRVEPVAMLALTMPGARAAFTVMMGHNRRSVIVPWNPLLNQPDRTLCSLCRRPAEKIRVCRELHWLCELCWKKCPECGREFCPVCKPKGCSH